MSWHLLAQHWLQEVTVIFFFLFLFIFLLLKVSSSFFFDFAASTPQGSPVRFLELKSLSVHLIQLPWSSVPDWVFLDCAHRHHILEISGGVKDPHPPRPTTATTTHRSICLSALCFCFQSTSRPVSASFLAGAPSWKAAARVAASGLEECFLGQSAQRRLSSSSLSSSCRSDSSSSLLKISRFSLCVSPGGEISRAACPCGSNIGTRPQLLSELFIPYVFFCFFLHRDCRQTTTLVFSFPPHTRFEMEGRSDKRRLGVVSRVLSCLLFYTV